MPKALITGINGFVGPYLKDELEKNYYQVFGLDNTEGQMRKGRFFLVNIANKSEVEKVVGSLSPDLIFHLAGFSSPFLAEKNPELVEQINVGGTKNLLDVACKISKPPKILIVSSSHVYGDPKYLPVDEKHPLLGKGAYAKSRIKQEELVLSYREKLPFVIARSFNHTGPRQSEDFVVPNIIKQVIEVAVGRRQFFKFGDLNVKRDISDVRDVVAAYRMLLGQDKIGLVCNVCRGQSIALKNIVENVKVLARLHGVDIMEDAGLVRSGEPVDMYGDNSFLKSLTGWKIQRDYEQMINDIFLYWKQKILTDKL